MSGTPRMNHAPVKMRLAKDDFDDINALGDFFIGERGGGEHRQLYFTAAVPTAKKPFLKKENGWTFCSVPIRSDADRAAGIGRGWGWDGNRENPTLTPSIDVHGSWHGWIRNGEMVEA